MVVLTYVPASKRPIVTIESELVTVRVGDTQVSFMREQFNDLVFEIEAALAREEVAKQELESNEDS